MREQLGLFSFVDATAVDRSGDDSFTQVRGLGAHAVLKSLQRKSGAFLRAGISLYKYDIKQENVMPQLPRLIIGAQQRTVPAYGGYSTTSYGAQGGDDSGGFLAGASSQQGSQGGSKAYQDESLRPVTIKQILEAEEAYAGADFKIDNTTVTQITFVGQIRSINPQPTNITFKIDDGTGQIEVKKWIDVDKQDNSNAEFELDAHVRVWGRLKSFSNKRHVGAHVIRPVADFNEVNYHLLEAAYVHLFYTKGPLGDSGSGGAGGGAKNGESMFVDGGGYGNDSGGAGGQTMSKLTGCGPQARNVFKLINDASSNEGVHVNVITSSLKMSVREVLAASDELLGQGLIYTTVDDETWAPLEY
ncbi:hypothetical protein E4U17_007623 [Claviceps sp. LM77 group G4]|nr:hypothetical protein E4U17_007623 [Claviceps sp. LM77 group G4]